MKLDKLIYVNKIVGYDPYNSLGVTLTTTNQNKDIIHWFERETKSLREYPFHDAVTDKLSEIPLEDLYKEDIDVSTLRKIDEAFIQNTPENIRNKFKNFIPEENIILETPPEDLPIVEVPIQFPINGIVVEEYVPEEIILETIKKPKKIAAKKKSTAKPKNGKASKPKNSSKKKKVKKK